MVLTILFPCLNEEKTIAQCIEEARIFLNTYSIDGEIMVVDNGSLDNTASIALAHHVSVVYAHQKGYGNALREGIKQITSEYTIMLDADGSYDIQDAKAILEKLQSGFDFVVGNRFAGRMDYDAMPWMHRYIGNPLLSLIGRKLYQSHVQDWHCGMRGFVTSTMQSLNFESTGMEFASEMIICAEKKGLRIGEVPVHYRKDKRMGSSHLNWYSDGMRHLKLLWEKKSV